MSNLEDTTVNFLQKAADYVLPLKDTNLILKSYYLLQCRQIISQKSSSITEKKFGTPNKRCARCGLLWTDGGQKIEKLPPRQLSKNVKRKLVAKLRKKKDDTGLKFLLAGLNGSLSEKQCLFCKHKSTVIANKHQCSDVTKEPEIKEIDEKADSKRKRIVPKSAKKGNPIFTPSKVVFSKQEEQKIVSVPKAAVKKSKKKDKFAGLCQIAVLAAKEKTNNGLADFLKKAQ